MQVISKLDEKYGGVEIRQLIKEKPDYIERLNTVFDDERKICLKGEALVYFIKARQKARKRISQL